MASCWRGPARGYRRPRGARLSPHTEAFYIASSLASPKHVCVNTYGGDRHKRPVLGFIDEGE